MCFEISKVEIGLEVMFKMPPLMMSSIRNTFDFTGPAEEESEEEEAASCDDDGEGSHKSVDSEGDDLNLGSYFEDASSPNMKNPKAAKPKSKGQSSAAKKPKGKPHSKAKPSPVATPVKSPPVATPSKSREEGGDAAGSGSASKRRPSPSPHCSPQVEGDGLGKRGRRQKALTSESDVYGFVNDEGLLQYRNEFSDVQAALTSETLEEWIPGAKATDNKKAIEEV